MGGGEHGFSFHVECDAWISSLSIFQIGIERCRNHPAYESTIMCDEKSDRPYLKAPPQTATCKFPWCKTASIGNLGNVLIESIKAAVTIKSRTYDISKSACWMDFIEQKEGRRGDEGGAGAYDTLRCDVIVSSPKHEVTGKQTSVVWGEKFHFDRLRSSFFELAPSPTSNGFEESVEKALKQSHEILHQLLSLAESEVRSMKDEYGANTSKSTLVQLVRITILWSPMHLMEDSFRKDIIVRGHACCTLQLISPNESPVPITVSIAAFTTKGGDKDIVSVDASLPTRHTNPQSKIASWCRLRQQLETNTYKAPGVEEVIMIRPVKCSHHIERFELLEGLSSNVFVIYKGGRVRTAIDGCLHGYVRHLVLNSLDQCGLKFDPRPIFLDESSLWAEVFISSSSRLIYPISKILMRQHTSARTDERSFVEIWRDEASTSSFSAEVLLKQPKWRRLLKVMLKAEGFDDSSFQ